MKFQIQKISPATWSVTPLEGKFQGQQIGVAESVNLRDATFHARTITGNLQSTWGLEITNPLIYEDGVTIKGLGIGKNFDKTPTTRLDMDFNGVKIHHRTCKGARTVVTDGPYIYAKQPF